MKTSTLKNQGALRCMLLVALSLGGARCASPNEPIDGGDARDSGDGSTVDATIIDARDATADDARVESDASDGASAADARPDGDAIDAAEDSAMDAASDAGADGATDAMDAMDASDASDASDAGGDSATDARDASAVPDSGDAARPKVVYLQSGALDTNSGLAPTAPVGSFSRAFSVLATLGCGPGTEACRLLVRSGAYNELATVAVPSNVTIVAGYLDATYTSRGDARATILRVAASPAMSATSLTGPSRIDGLSLEATPSLGAGASVTTLFVRTEQPFAFVNGRVVGAVAPSAAPAGAAPAATCARAAGGLGGSAVISTMAGNCGATRGSAGDPSPDPMGPVGGAGAEPGASNCTSLCDPVNATNGYWGADGATGRGAPSPLAETAVVRGSFASGTFVPVVAQPGLVGGRGSGGGGGGQGGHKVMSMCCSGVELTGGAGGRGGVGGCGGAGGLGGRQGGASVAILVLNAARAPTVFDMTGTVMRLGQGGAGGRGGDGTAGELGAAGERGLANASQMCGARNYVSGDGGLGGRGGHGGAGSGGNGGAGGPTIGLVTVNAPLGMAPMVTGFVDAGMLGESFERMGGALGSPAPRGEGGSAGLAAMGQPNAAGQGARGVEGTVESARRE